MENSKKITARTIAMVMAMAAVFSFAACGDTDADSSAATTTTTTAAAESEAEESQAEESEAEESVAETEAPEESQAEESEAETEAPADDVPAEFDITKVAGYDENATESVIEVDFYDDAWGNALGQDYIDARTFDRDKELTLTIDYVLSDSLKGMLDEGVTDLHSTQIVVGPAYANGWTKLAGTPGDTVHDYPEANVIEEEGSDEWVNDGENVVSVDDADVWAPVFNKKDGFIKITDPEITQVKLTLTADTVNKLIDNATAVDDEGNAGWDGILFQMGGNQKITKITIDQGNVFLASAVNESMS